jgi:hypothetical protein
MTALALVAEKLRALVLGNACRRVSPAQLRYYLNEFTFRFNARRCKKPRRGMTAAAAALIGAVCLN